MPIFFALLCFFTILILFEKYTFLYAYAKHSNVISVVFRHLVLEYFL